MKNKQVLAAVLATVIFWMVLPVQADEAAAIAALREAGFKVKQAAGATELGFGQPEWTADLWQRLGEITSLTVLRGTAKCADNAGLEVLAKLPRLETLYLNASTFDDEGFETLAKIKSLQSLAFDHNGRFSGRGASALKSLPNLRSLRFGGCMKFTGEEVMRNIFLILLLAASAASQAANAPVGPLSLPLPGLAASVGTAAA